MGGSGGSLCQKRRRQKMERPKLELQIALWPGASPKASIMACDSCRRRFWLEAMFHYALQDVLKYLKIS